MGEPRALLRAAFLATRTHQRADGALELSGEIPPELARPFQRAFDRVADELRAADELAEGPVRSDGQRRADALVALLLRVADSPLR